MSEDVKKEGNDSSTPKESSAKEESPEGDKTVPYSRFKEVNDKVKDLETKLQEKEKPEQKKDESFEEFKTRMAKYKEWEEEQTQVQEKEIQSSLSNLHETYGDFEDEKLLNIVNTYGVKNFKGEVDWDKGMELYKSLRGRVGSTNKNLRTPSGKRTSDEVPKKEQDPRDLHRKSIFEIAQEAKRKISG